MHTAWLWYSVERWVLSLLPRARLVGNTSLPSKETRRGPRAHFTVTISGKTDQFSAIESPGPLGAETTAHRVTPDFASTKGWVHAAPLLSWPIARRRPVCPNAQPLMNRGSLEQQGRLRIAPIASKEGGRVLSEPLWVCRNKVQQGAYHTGLPRALSWRDARRITGGTSRCLPGLFGSCDDSGGGTSLQIRSDPRPRAPELPTLRSGTEDSTAPDSAQLIDLSRHGLGEVSTLRPIPSVSGLLLAHAQPDEYCHVWNTSICSSAVFCPSSGPQGGPHGDKPWRDPCTKRTGGRGEQALSSADEWLVCAFSRPRHRADLSD